MAADAIWQDESRTVLRQIVHQATVALIAMDADRLEQLAVCCVDLNREINLADASKGKRRSTRRTELAETLGEKNLEFEDGELPQFQEVELELLAKVLFETRANLVVLSHLHKKKILECGFLELPSNPTHEPVCKMGARVLL